MISDKNAIRQKFKYTIVTQITVHRSNRCVFNCLLNLAMSEMSRRYCGRAFQSVGPAMLNALLPAKVDRVNGTHSRLCSCHLDGTYDLVLVMWP